MQCLQPDCISLNSHKETKCAVPSTCLVLNQLCVCFVFIDTSAFVWIQEEHNRFHKVFKRNFIEKSSRKFCIFYMSVIWFYRDNRENWKQFLYQISHFHVRFVFRRWSSTDTSGIEGVKISSLMRLAISVKGYPWSVLCRDLWTVDDITTRNVKFCANVDLADIW